jgi:hypothetical protein
MRCHDMGNRVSLVKRRISFLTVVRKKFGPNGRKVYRLL